MITKQKVFEILITALLGAGIAFLQSLLSYLSHLPAFDSSMTTAGISAAVIHAIR